MKNVLIVLGVLCLQVVFGAFTEEDIPPSYKECLKEHNSMTLEEFGATLNEDFTVTEGNSKYNDVVLCAYRKDNYVDADDTLDNVKFHNILVNELMKWANLNLANPEEAATNAIEACKSVEGSDAGDTLVKNYNCVMKFLKKL